MTPDGTVTQINQLLAPLIETGLAIDQGFPYRRDHGGGVSEVTFPNHRIVSVVKVESYVETYDSLSRGRAFNAKFEDGALLQMSYLFAGGQLRRHRLAFLGSPYELEEDAFGLNSADGRFGSDHLNGRPTTVVRFDYDEQDHPWGSDHPKSHLTLGLYEHCRIPVSAPLTPFRFLDFILRHFYPPDTCSLQAFSDTFADCLSDDERGAVHLVLPQG